MITKNSYTVAALLLIALCAGAAVFLMPSAVKADGCEAPGSCPGGSGYDVYDGYAGNGGYDVYDGYNTPSYYEPTGSSYYEPSSYSYYEPSDYSYYEPSSYSYYEPSSYSSYQPSSYNYGGYDYSYQPYSSYSYTPPSSNYNYNYDYSYDYVYDSETTTTTQYCPSGYTGTYPNCYPPVQYCPAGYTGTYPNCHAPVHNHDVSCNLDASDTSVSEGDRVTLDWDTDGDVTYASINQGVGRVDESGGSERVTVDNDTTYKLTVRNDNGDEDTCSVTVRVDDNNFSSVSFTGTPVNNPPVVYLSDIPYTGLEDIDPVLLSYWLMLIAAAGAGVWFLYRKGMIPHFAFASAEPIDEGHIEEIEEGHADAAPAPEVMSFLSALEAGDTEGALDYVRDAAATGTPVEDFLGEAEAAATDADLQAKVSAALEASKETGIRGAKEALA